jgi:subtilisin family serine protease
MNSLDFDHLLDIGALRQALSQATGRGVVVGLLDSGVDVTHPDLRGAVVRSIEVAEDRFGLSVRELPPGLSPVQLDAVGHGTACAGIIRQVAPEARLVSVRVLGANASGTGAQFVHGLQWVLSQTEPAVRVLNLSLGTLESRYAALLRKLVDQAYFEGRVVVAACNNMGQPSFPAQFASLIAVDSRSFSEPLAFEFRQSSLSEVVARGIYVRAPRPGGGHQLWTGTSFACPHITGIVARLLSIEPRLTPFQIKTLLHALRANRPGATDKK